MVIRSNISKVDLVNLGILKRVLPLRKEIPGIPRYVTLDPINHLAQIAALVLVNTLQDMLSSNEVNERHMANQLQNYAKVSYFQNHFAVVLTI